jgi:hypothetical protein
MKLSALSILLGLSVAASGIWAILKPNAFGAAARKFPRSVSWGYLLVALATGWFLYYLSIESVSDFAAYKPAMYIGFSALGVLTCIFLEDFLAARGLAVVLLLLAKAMLDASMFNNSQWRLLIAVWAYVLIVAGMWITVSPWRLRDFIQFGTASDGRIKILGGFRLGFGLLVAILGVVAF